jgi:UDP-N-acetylglucosamine 2-epimerase (non-hydrolysing)
MKNKKIVHIVGARPNFMKLAPVYRALNAYSNLKQIIIHTGQHYDINMSDIFFKELGIPLPDENLDINDLTSLEQIGNGILKLSKILPNFNADLVIIYGDINATAYASIVCSKIGLKIAHIEAGLRSFDKSMPEETNRIIADSLCDYFFTPSKDADLNLLNAGITEERIFFVGNVMIDTLINSLPKSNYVSFPFDIPDEFGLVTLHRPSNVDDKQNLASIIIALEDIAKKCPLIFPLHPRTKEKLVKSKFSINNDLILTEPLGYLQFLKLQKKCKFIITDSGGIQEESTYLNIPCFTLRNNTERPITVEIGTNILVGTNVEDLKKNIDILFTGHFKKGRIPDFWDGKASLRIAKIVNRLLLN